MGSKLWLGLALVCGAILLSYWTSKETAKTDAAAEAANMADTPPAASAPAETAPGTDPLSPPVVTEGAAAPAPREEAPSPPPASADAPPTPPPGYPPDATGFPPPGSPYAGDPGAPVNPNPVPYGADAVPYTPPPVYPDGAEGFEGDIPPPSQYDPMLSPDGDGDFASPPPEEGF